jgi:hypothetical protein
MLRRLAFLSICVWASSAQEIPLGSGGVITGTLQGEDGTAIAGGNVTLQRTPPYPPGKWPRTIWSTTSGSGGSFRFEGLYQGQYRLCAQVLNSVWLNPCAWGLKPPVMSLSSSQRSVNVMAILKKGVAVPVRIDDPGQLLSQHEGNTPGALLLLGVRNDALAFHSATVTSRDSNGRNHEIVIPFDTPVKLTAFSSFFQLADENGTALSPTASTAVPLTVPSGTTPSTIKFIVIGRGR